MYECPNCGGNLKFNIARQQMYCEYCGTQKDPYCFFAEKDTQEQESPSGEYEVTVFTCPQCGGQIISEDTTAATFCSFCGGTVILDSRIGKERRPIHIIPFSKTKEDCQAAYQKVLRHAVFAPKKLKDKALIEKFRGIYMPYWVYSFEKEESITFPGRKSRREGNYLVTDHYRFDCDIEESYKGLAYDASSTFADRLSGAIAPFDLKQAKPFVPSFLSGFYADTNDVEQCVYLPEAEELVIQDAGRCLLENPLCQKYYEGDEEQERAFRKAVSPSKRNIELALLPVWFLSCRSGDRITYAVVNGQTGKTAADLPIDLKRYLSGSFLLSMPLFILLNLFFTVTPGKLLLTAILLACLCAAISCRQLFLIFSRESGKDDKGLASLKPAAGGNWPVKRKRLRVWKSVDTGIILMILFMFLVYRKFILLLFLFYLLGSGRRLFALASDSISRRRRWRKNAFGDRYFQKILKKMLPVFGKPLSGISVAVVILLVHPVSDWFYYIGAMICMGSVLWAIKDIIIQHNRLTTHKFPQLNRRGGDEFE